VRRLVPLAILGAVLATASCAPPSGPAGSGDGGVAVSNPSATPAATAPAPVDVVLSDTAGLAAPMTLYPFADSAPAGDVVFRVKNVGTVDHELVLLKTDTPFDQLPVADAGDPPAPVTAGADKVDETNNVAETGDPNLRPGDTRSFTAKNLAPGHYVLVCNLAKHYGLGMRAAFTVTAAGTPAQAPVSNVSVSLKDTSGLNGPMSVVPSATVGAAGNITFTAKNDGTIDHELILLKTDTPFDQIPIADAGDPPAPVKTGANKVDEAANIAETGDPNLKPGESRTFGAKGLAPGHYVLICNLAQHYGLGMRAAFTVVAPASSPPSTIKASLNDTAGLSGPMSITVDSAFGKAGDITFNVTNNGTIDHELIVLKTDTPFDQIPIADAGDPPAPVKTGANKVDEANNIAETGDPNLKPGETRTFTAKGLASGNYVLICNLAQHYGLGMRIAFVVP